MKVLMTTDTVGGVWTYALQLAESLQAWDVQVALATQGAELTDHQRHSAEQIPNVELHESAYRLEWMTDPWEDVAAAGEWLQDLARTVQPDLVHLNDYSHGGLEWNAPVLMVGHSCVFSWFEAVRGQAPGPEWSRYRQQVRRGLRGADLVVAPTRAMLDSLDTFYGPFTATRVIPNGIDASRYRSGWKKPVVFVAGRVWDEAKNISAVVKAAPKLKWPVVVAGLPNPDGQTDTPEGVNFLGRLSPGHLADWYGQATIYALPAKYEPFGLTPLEAALSGCALVLGDIATLREVWGDTAVFVPPSDPEALVSAVNRLIDDADLRNDYALRAGERARTYTAEAMAARYAAAYAQLTGKAHAVELQPEAPAAS